MAEKMKHNLNQHSKKAETIVPSYKKRSERAIRRALTDIPERVDDWDDLDYETVEKFDKKARLK